MQFYVVRVCPLHFIIYVANPKMTVMAETRSEINCIV